MAARKGQFIGGLETETAAVCSCERHGLSQIVIEIVVKLFLLVRLAAEYVYVISARRAGFYDGIGAHLVCTCFWFHKRHL